MLCRQPKPMMVGLSPKHLFVVLLALFLTAGFSLSAVQASAMSARMMVVESSMAMPVHTGMGKMADASMNGDRKAWVKHAGGSDNPIHCPPTCIAPVLAVLPQGLAMITAPRAQQPSAMPAPFLRGRNSLPDPFPPRPSA